MSDAKPFPKSQQLARGERRYRRKVAGGKAWQRIIDEKRGPCRWCEVLGVGVGTYGPIQYHHIVSRSHGGGDVADNIIPLHQFCHRQLHTAVGNPVAALGAQRLLASLTDAEYAYMIDRGGEDYPERAYGIRYER